MQVRQAARSRGASYRHRRDPAANFGAESCFLSWVRNAPTSVLVRDFRETGAGSDHKHEFMLSGSTSAQTAAVQLRMKASTSGHRATQLWTHSSPMSRVSGRSVRVRAMRRRRARLLSFKASLSGSRKRCEAKRRRSESSQRRGAISVCMEVIMSEPNQTSGGTSARSTAPPPAAQPPAPPAAPPRAAARVVPSDVAGSAEYWRRVLRASWC